MLFTILGQSDAQCQTIKQLEIHCSTIRQLDKTLPDNIYIVSMLTDFDVLSKLNLSYRRHFVQERHMPLSGPLLTMSIEPTILTPPLLYS